MVRLWMRIALLSCGTLLTGCASSAGPDVVTVTPGQYEAAFDAAMDAARAQGMEPTLRDRRSGVIETGPVLVGSVLEPWSGDNTSVAQAWDNTLAFHRRRARFEFAPVGYRTPAEADAEVSLAADGVLTGPELLNDDPMVDLTRTGVDLEVRVWVFVERSHTVGVRRSTWSRRQTRKAFEASPDPKWEERPLTFWEPVARDDAAERRLLAEVVSALAIEAAVDETIEVDVPEADVTIDAAEAARVGFADSPRVGRKPPSDSALPDGSAGTTTSTS